MVSKEVFEEKMKILEQKFDIVDKFVKNHDRAINGLFNELFYNKFTVTQDIPFEFLDKPNPGDKLVLPTVQGGVIHTVKRETAAPQLIEYDTYWTSGAILLKHYHSNAIEELAPLEGEFEVTLEIKNNGIKENVKYILKVGDTLTIDRGIPHQTAALEKGSLEVRFIYSPPDNLTPSFT
ncbi:cupin domain-containing protein [Aquimarina sp. 2-A2]